MASKSAKERVRSAAYVGTAEDAKAESRSPLSSTTALLTKFANGTTLKHSVGDLSPGMRNVLAYFGLNKKFSDSMAKEGGISVDDAIEVCEEVWDSLKRGVWREPTERGPNIGIIIQAIIRARGEKFKDQAAKDAREADLGKKLADEGTRKGIMEDVRVKAAYATIMAERAAERAKEAQAVATKAGAGAKTIDI